MITIGFPTYDDFSGIALTLQSLTLYHDLTDVEILVIDNHPTQAAGRESDATRKLRNYCLAIGARYIPMGSPVGTAPPRNRIFAEATGDVVIVADGHVMFAPTTIPAVRDYFANPDHAGDILTGPILGKQRRPAGQGLAPMATHYADVWRSEMWGVWAQAWSCGCGRWLFDVGAKLPPAPDVSIDDSGRIVTAPVSTPQPTCEYFPVAMGRTPVARCPECGETLPEALPYAGHDRALDSAGYARKCWDNDSTPFEITGLGLGMFAMRRERWPGFPADMIGFGGGELHLHELVRRDGGIAVCHPLCGWWHRFERDRVPYPLQLWHKVRNYVLWRMRLDMPLDPVYEHFVAGPNAKLTQAQWEHLLADPVASLEYPAQLAPQTSPSVNGRPQPPAEADSIEGVYQWQLRQKRDCVEHLPTIHDLAARCRHVVSCVKRREWDVAVLAGQPGQYTSHNTESDPLHDVLTRHVSPQSHSAYWSHDTADSLTAEPTDCDLLILDTVHSADRLTAELARWAPHCRRWIAIRGTRAFGEVAEGTKAPGLLVAARKFMADHPQWHRVLQDDRQYGLTVLSCDPAERTIDRGPGTELHKIFSQIGIDPSESCGCRAKTREMDAWGVAGCREHLTDIVDHLRAHQDKYGWKTKLTAAAGVMTSGLWMRLNWLDPFPGLVNESIRRAEQADLDWEWQHGAA